MNKSVLVDIDDTLSETQVEILKYINSKSEREYIWDELTREFREGKDPEYQKLVQEYLLQPELVGATLPYKDALDAIKKLHKNGYEIHIASSRKEMLHETTLTWLEKHGIINYIEKVHPRTSNKNDKDFKV